MKKKNHIMIQIIYVVFEFQYLRESLMQFYLFFVYISNIYLI